ncbi:MAG: right-handed parallel beta-helix repeat-containing protein, partial [Candidatus Omnitrophota bacterium]
DVNGYKIRSETDLTNWFAVDLALNSRNAGEAEFIGGVRFTIPLELGRVLSRKSPLKITTPSSYIEDRVFERVVRDIDVQSKSVTKKEDVPGIDMIYVDNTNTGTEDGTLEHPYNTLDEAFGSGRYSEGKYVYVFKGDGTNAGYTGNFPALLDDVVLWGSGYNGGYRGLPTPGFPIIDGDGTGYVITLGNNNTVMGLQVQNSGEDYTGIRGINIDQASILYNNITNNGGGIYFGFGDGVPRSNFSIIGNTISGNSGEGIGFFSNGDITATVSDNTVSDNDNVGIGFLSVGGNLNVSLLRNNVSDTRYTEGDFPGGIFLLATGNEGVGGDITATISDNTVSGNDTIGIALFSFGSNINATLLRNNISDTKSLGGDIEGSIILVAGENEGVGGGNLNATLSDNSITVNEVAGVALVTAVGSTTATLTGNTVTANAGGGVIFITDTGAPGSEINLGDGNSGGNNSLYGNVGSDLQNDSGIDDLFAQGNWWGQAGGPITGQITGANTVDSSNPLPSPP